MTIARLNHVMVTVPKGAEDEARAFYCGVLGLREIPKPGSLQERGGFWLAVGGMEVHVGTEDGVDRAATKAHFAYEVDDLSPWRESLARAGCPISESVPIPGYDRFEFRDPFGNRIELIARRPESDTGSADAPNESTGQGSNEPHEDLFERYLADAGRPFSGWDFSLIDDRMVTEPLGWSYTSIILPFRDAAASMLDMGTGGGEKLATLQPLPPRTAATENYPKNVPVAKARLAPLGVRVVSGFDDEALPFEDGEFSLVINRHESYAPSEVFRILAPGGVFITQQVGDQNDLMLNEMLGAPPPADDGPWNAAFAAQELAEAGFEIRRTEESMPRMRVFDIGAVVFHLNAIPWQIEDFSVDRYRGALQALHRRVTADGYVESREHRFLIVAAKPA